MYEEDVEELFESVPMGTPVEIIYDRVIMEEAPDHTVSYYIYPDGYGWEPLTVSSVKEYLAHYGVEDFATPDEVYHKIIASDGSVTYVAKHYDLVINGRKLKKKYFGKDGSIWIPAVETSVAAKVGAYWDGETNTLMTRLGKVPGIVKSDVVYINEKDLESVFHIKGHLTEDLVYEADTFRRQNLLQNNCAWQEILIKGSGGSSLLASCMKKTSLPKGRCRIIFPALVLFVTCHAVNAELHHEVRIKTEHVETLFDDITAASCGKLFIFEFLFEPFQFHAVDPFRTHECVCHDDACQFVHGEKTFSRGVAGSNSSVHTPQPWEMIVRISSSSTPSGARNSRTWRQCSSGYSS